MNEVTTTKLLAIIAVIFVTAALVTLPYQSQVANAAPMKKYQFYVTLIGVPANAEDLIMNVTLNQDFFPHQIKTVSSPTEGEVVKFVVSAPPANPNGFYVCGNTADFTLSSCEFHSLPSKVSGPIRVDYSYPT